MKLTYEVVAGKYDNHDRNIKYINSFDTLEEAFDDVFDKDLMTYPWCEIEIRGALEGAYFVIDCKDMHYSNTRT